MFKFLSSDLGPSVVTQTCVFESFLRIPVPPFAYNAQHYHQHSKKAFPILTVIQDLLTAKGSAALLCCWFNCPQKWFTYSLHPTFLGLYLALVTYMSVLGKLNEPLEGLMYCFFIDIAVLVKKVPVLCHIFSDVPNCFKEDIWSKLGLPRNFECQ